jgi:NADP-dependent aldehyde dehydrogenase
MSDPLRETFIDDADTVAETVATVQLAGRGLARLSRTERARLLVSMAEQLGAVGTQLIDTAHRETHLDRAALTAELERTMGQLAFQGSVIRDGAYLEVAIDHVDTEVRKMLLPLGPVAVFGSSNFPFAYGVAGGDTASALAAGCPVVVKEHPSHPETCRVVLDALRAGARAVGVSEWIVALVRGFEAGQVLVQDPRIRAVGFTGSVAGGRALHDLCVARTDPIPFYGELGSLNPVVVSAGAAAQRGQAVATIVADSMLGRGGQMCTKPGLVLVPTGAAGDALVASLTARVGAATPVTLLNETVRSQFVVGLRELQDLEGAIFPLGIATGAAGTVDTGVVPPVLVEVSAQDLGDTVLQEVFGPICVVVRYDNTADVGDVLTGQEPALVGAIHALEAEDGLHGLVELMSDRVGRLVWGGPTTGLHVGWATHHGGAYPASTSAAHTSVGAGAIRRWLRPMAYQGLPAHLLPDDLRDSAEAPPRRTDGTWRAAG